MAMAFEGIRDTVGGVLLLDDSMVILPPNAASNSFLLGFSFFICSVDKFLTTTSLDYLRNSIYEKLLQDLF